MTATMHPAYRSVQTFALTLLILFCPSASANPLQDILESPEFKGMPRHNIPERAEQLLLYVDPETNYGSLMLEKGSRSSLEVWLQPVPARYKILKTRVKRFHEYTEFTQIYQNKRAGFDFYLKIFIPTPKFMESVRMGIIRQFAELEPPILRVESSEELSVGGDIPATLYNRKDETASLLVKLPRNSLLNLLCTKDEATTDMVELANVLNIREVRDRLAN